MPNIIFFNENEIDAIKYGTLVTIDVKNSILTLIIGKWT